MKQAFKRGDLVKITGGPIVYFGRVARYVHEKESGHVVWLDEEYMYLTLADGELKKI